MARWEDFENLAEQIFAELQPSADVKRNDFIDGQFSEKKRQIDVSIRWNDGEDAYLTIVQAKDHGRPADIKIVDEFLSVIRDIQATGGILVCRSGFTKTAHTYARNCGVSLLNIHDAQSANWALELSIPVVWVELMPVVQCYGSPYFEAGNSFPTDDPLGLPLTTSDKRHRVNPVSTFEKFWNSPAANREVGVEHNITSSDPVYAIVYDANEQVQLRPVEGFRIAYTVEQKAWLGRFRPADCRGLIDYLDNRAFTASYLPMTEIPAQRNEGWEPIDDPRAVVIRSRGTLVGTTEIKFVSGGAFGKLDVSYLGPELPEERSV
ncbi:restriction endonuclease [Catenulispora pinisilvae]|uniref:restriction endonuclease n=1 Tax=Catenulispora pinisilvae TaxID=2705253 RepID=UPI0018923CDA|nr:restriction endonuclease [Catenulispora pinisilvae]